MTGNTFKQRVINRFWLPHKYRVCITAHVDMILSVLRSIVRSFKFSKNKYRALVYPVHRVTYTDLFFLTKA